MIIVGDDIYIDMKYKFLFIYLFMHLVVLVCMKLIMSCKR